jgi:hypothetical protein
LIDTVYYHYAIADGQIIRISKFLNPNTSRCIQTRDVRIMSHVVYNCANAIEKYDKIFLPFSLSISLSLSLSISVDAIGRIQTLDLKIICQCSTTVLAKLKSVLISRLKKMNFNE